MKTIQQIVAITLLGLLLVSFSNCGGTKMNETYTFETTPPFSISDAYIQDWVAGVKDGGSGTNVHITIAKLPETVQIEKIHYKSMVADAIQNLNTATFVGYFKNDINSREDIIMDGDSTKEYGNEIPLKSKFKLSDNEAVLQYVENNKTYYYKLSSINKMPLLAYPTANPLGGLEDNN